MKMQIRLITALLAAHASAVAFNCDHIRVDKTDFNLEKLGGPHSVVTTLRQPPSHSNTSYTVDICKPLKRKGDVPKGEECPSGTRVCAIQRTYGPEEEKGLVRKVVPIAGELADQGGSEFEYEASRLKPAADSDREGLRLTLKGGAYPLDGPAEQRKKQRAVIDFICDREMEGTEGEWATEEEYEKDKKDEKDEKDEKEKRSGLAGMGAGGILGTRGDGLVGGFADGEEQLFKEGAALKFVSYGVEPDGDFEELRLEWRTKYACESTFEDERSAGWGFFTWFLIILFMLIAAYLIFGSWLNYTRYGARGWDLLPHGDTIRDVPYLMKDWMRSVLNTVQGSGSRGGYSAV